MLDIMVHELADFPQWLPIISGWLYQERRGLYAVETPTDAEQRMVSWLQRDRIPTALVALANGKLAGAVALKDRDHQFGKAPWLVGLYVLPDFRNRGIGTQLLRAAENKARAIGLRKLYLYTPKLKDFYGAHGWNLHQEIVLTAGKVTIMEKLLSPHNLFQAPPPARRG